MSNEVQKKRPRAPRPRITVTQAHIDDAKQRSSSHCMIAEAVKAAVPGAARVSVDLQTIRFTDPGKGLRYTYLTPRNCQVPLVGWDAGVTPEPWDFELRQGQVTASGPPKRDKKRDRLSKATLRKDPTGKVAERIGGKTPPLVKGPDNVAFSRRRAFGLRGLQV